MSSLELGYSDTPRLLCLMDSNQIQRLLPYSQRKKIQWKTKTKKIAHIRMCIKGRLKHCCVFEEIAFFSPTGFLHEEMGIKIHWFSTNLPIFLYVQDKHVSPHLPKNDGRFKSLANTRHLSDTCLPVIWFAGDRSCVYIQVRQEHRFSSTSYWFRICVPSVCVPVWLYLLQVTKALQNGLEPSFNTTKASWTPPHMSL